MSQKYQGKIWVQNVRIKMWKIVTKKMWGKNVGVKKCEYKKCDSKKMFQ